MTPLNQLKTVEYALEPVAPVSVSHPVSGMRSLFVGPRGLRSGWRLLIFIGLLAVLFGGIALVRTGGPQGLRDAQKHLNNITVTPFKLGASEAIVFALLCMSTFVMGRLEHRKFSDYGLPPRQALGKDFWIGCLSGFLAISGTLLAMFLLHGFRIAGFALNGKAILYALAGWAIAFLMVGLCEEFLNRGYLQYTLACGIGFWPAAFVMSGFFAFGHAFNPHETLAGSLPLCYSDFCFAFSYDAAEISGVQSAFMRPMTGDRHCSGLLIAVSRPTTISSTAYLAGRFGSRAASSAPRPVS